MDRVLKATAAVEDTHFWHRALRRNARFMLSRALAGLSPRLIIDCGAGTGRNLDWLSDLGPSVGVEQSPVGVAHGRARGHRMVQASVTHLPFRDGAAEVVTSFDVLYCLDDLAERQAIREMWRVLTFDGVALINAAALQILHGSHSTLVYERRRYTRRGIASRLSDAGFALERLTYTNMPTFPIVLALRSKERLLGQASQASEADFRVPPEPLNFLFGAASIAESAWLRLANVPVGSSLMAVARKRRP